MKVRWSTNTDNTVLTGTWDTITAEGFTFWKDGRRISYTMDGTRTTARFGLDGQPHVFEIYALGKLDHATTAWPLPVIPPAPVPTGWDAAIAYTKTPPPFTVTRTVPVTDRASLAAALATIRPGDDIYAPQPFTCAGEFPIAAAPSGVARLRLDGITFTYTGTSNLPSVWVTGAANLQIFGGDIHGPPPGQVGNGCLTFYHATNVLWWGANIHDVTSTGIGMVPVDGPITNCDIYAKVTRWGQNPSWDPHAEKGTGEHGAQLCDGGTHVFTNNRVALDLADGLTGSGVQIGDANAGGTISGIRLLVRANGLHFKSTSQRAGNGLNLWGAVNMDIDVECFEVTDAQGYAVSVDNEYHADFSGVRFHGARESNTRQNPKWQTEPSFNPGPTYLP